jgi:hypothetical protein
MFCAYGGDCAWNRTPYILLDATYFLNNVYDSRAMALAVSRRPPTAEARVQFRVGPCGMCGGQSGTGTGFFPSTSVLPRQFYSTDVPLLGKMKKK